MKDMYKANHDRELDDFYATDPEVIRDLLNMETFNKMIYEPAAGQGHIVEVLKEYDYDVKYSDIVDRGYNGTLIKDFLKTKFKKDVDIDIITNPPYKHAIEFILKSLDIIKTGNKVAMLLKLTFLESQKRKIFFEKNPPKIIYVFSRRVICAKNAKFENYKSTTIAYCWFVWEKGFTGDPMVRWI